MAILEDQCLLWVRILERLGAFKEVNKLINIFLAIFMFMFGATGAVGAYVLYTKRQAVRGIAYQVFE